MEEEEETDGVWKVKSGGDGGWSGGGGIGG